jgi:hypothetical protein
MTGCNQSNDYTLYRLDLPGRVRHRSEQNHSPDQATKFDPVNGYDFLFDDRLDLQDNVVERKFQFAIPEAPR